MRCEARLDCAGSCASAVRAPPPGGGPAEAPSSATSASARALAQRRTGRLVEEVQVLRVDGDGHLVPELQLHVRRERRDEVRARADDRLAALAREHLLLLGLLGLDVARIDAEVRHRLAAE